MLLGFQERLAIRRTYQAFFSLLLWILRLATMGLKERVWLLLLPEQTSAQCYEYSGGPCRWSKERSGDGMCSADVAFALSLPPFRTLFYIDLLYFALSLVKSWATGVRNATAPFPPPAGWPSTTIAFTCTPSLQLHVQHSVITANSMVCNHSSHSCLSC